MRENEIELLVTEIGELVYKGIEDVLRLEYIRITNQFATFLIFMENGKRYILTIMEDD